MRYLIKKILFIVILAVLCMGTAIPQLTSSVKIVALSDEKLDWIIDLEFNDMRSQNFSRPYGSNDQFFEQQEHRIDESLIAYRSIDTADGDILNYLSLTSAVSGYNTYQALQSIASNQIINSGNTVYEAGTNITLLSGFEVRPGAHFTARIVNVDDCNSQSMNTFPDLDEMTNEIVEFKNIEEDFKDEDTKYFSFSAFPNPTRDFVTIEYTLHVDAIVHIELLNMFGQSSKLIVSHQNQKAGQYFVETSVSDLDVGTYIVRVTSGNQTESKQLIISR